MGKSQKLEILWIDLRRLKLLWVNPRSWNSMVKTKKAGIPEAGNSIVRSQKAGTSMGKS